MGLLPINHLIVGRLETKHVISRLNYCLPSYLKHPVANQYNYTKSNQ